MTRIVLHTMAFAGVFAVGLAPWVGVLASIGTHLGLQ